MAQFFVFLPSVLQVCLLENIYTYILSKNKNTKIQINKYIIHIRTSIKLNLANNLKTLIAIAAKRIVTKKNAKETTKKCLKFKLITTN